MYGRYPRFDIRYLPIAGSFSRGLALEIGSSQFDSDALLFFCDVDVVFSSEFIRKCRTNTVQGVSVYYPVLLSEFDPSSLDKHMLTIDGHRENHYKVRKKYLLKYIDCYNKESRGNHAFGIGNVVQHAFHVVILEYCHWYMTNIFIT